MVIFDLLNKLPRHPISKNRFRCLSAVDRVIVSLVYPFLPTPEEVSSFWISPRSIWPNGKAITNSIWPEGCPSTIFHYLVGMNGYIYYTASLSESTWVPDVFASKAIVIGLLYDPKTMLYTPDSMINSLLFLVSSLQKMLKKSLSIVSKTDILSSSLLEKAVRELPLCFHMRLVDGLR